MKLIHTTPEEFYEGPLPPWAIGYAKGELVLGAQLPTRDGRCCGNGHIIKDEPCEYTPWGMEDAPEDSPHRLYTVMTDAGSIMQMNKTEVRDQFYPPVWVSDVEDVIRKFGPKPEPDPETQCCRRAKATRGWNHNEDCKNWVLCY